MTAARPTTAAARSRAIARSGLTAVPSPAMDRVAALASRVLGVDSALISLVEVERQVFPGAVGLSPALQAARQTPIEQSMCRTVAEDAVVLQIDDAAADPRWATHPAHTELGTAAYLGAPLVDVDGVVLGSLCVVSATPRRWSADDRRLVTDLAFAASSELQARLASARADHAAHRLQLMADASAALSSSLDVVESLERMLDVVVPDLAHWSAVVVPPRGDEPGLLVCRHADRGADPRLARAITDASRELRAQPEVEAVLAGRAGVQVLRAGPGAELMGRISASASPETHDDGSLHLLVPIRSTGDDVLGIWALHPAEPGDASHHVDVELATDLGVRTGAALRNARTYQRERAVAVALQQGMLPTLPDVEGIELHGAYRPAAEGVEVGGDWFDAQLRHDGVLSASVGDVTGHSIEAAAAMGRLSGAIRCWAHTGMGPADILTGIDGFAGRLMGELFATCACLELRPAGDGWDVEIALAGHPPPLLLGPDGRATVLEVSTQPLLGLPVRTERRTSRLHLPSGSMLVAYTDGLVERRGELVDHGLERLRLALEDLADVPAAELCDRLVRALEPSGDDDVAVLVLRPS